MIRHLGTEHHYGIQMAFDGDYFGKALRHVTLIPKLCVNTINRRVKTLVPLQPLILYIVRMSSQLTSRM